MTAISFIRKARIVIGLLLFIWTLSLSFYGFPLGLISWLGAAVYMVGWGTAIACVFHNEVNVREGRISSGQRFIRACIGFAMAGLGVAMINWGGLISVTFSDTITLDFQLVAGWLGTFAGLFNVDREMDLPLRNVRPTKSED